jgi:O-antigen/teichoic acid export membrane protein
MFPLLQTLDGPTKILIANLCASTLMLLLLLPEYRALIQFRFRWPLWKSMAGYGFPLMLAGLAGIANELADRQFLKYLLPPDTAFEQLGVYGAVYKLSIFLVLFVQAFRYAAEPFFFRLARDSGDRGVLARTMNLYALVLGGVFIGLCAGMPVLKHFIDAKFWEGLDIVWILFLVLGTTNAVNLTDGLEGLASGADGIAFISYIIVTLWQIRQMTRFDELGGYYTVRDPLDLAVFAAACAGACSGSRGVRAAASPC